ncbi:sugar transferase [Maridesulfovibrio sp.]|uniref:sugar transferase n=1 Tax=Maridesulfovibrio sp. TaxID=2795000 RepID=UPI003BA89C65
MSLFEKPKAVGKVDCPGRTRDSFRIDFENIPDRDDLGWKCRMLLGKIVALILIILMLPIFVFVGLLIKLHDPGPIFYFGERLGYKMNIFHIYKFRTLPVGSQKKIGGEVFTSKHEEISNFGKFLRDTRIDELPQLINVLQGDMVLVGPRPVRPEMYQKLCLNIPKYEMRFMMYPGLVGYAQLFTPHGTPKHIRAYINNNLYLHNAGILKNFRIILYGAWVLSYNLTRKILKIFTEELINKTLAKLYDEKRDLVRMSSTNFNVEIADLRQCHAMEVQKNSFRSMNFTSSGILRDINDTHFRLCTNAELNTQKYMFRLATPICGLDSCRLRRAYCRGKVILMRNAPAGSGCKNEYLVIYKGETALQSYFIEKYFLELSIA